MHAELRIIVIGSLIAFTTLCANPARNPKRAIGGQSADLTPLVHWWQHPTGQRPLSGWAHVTGRIVGTNAYGWTVEGRVEEAGKPGEKIKKAGSSSKFILKTPPVQEYAEFNQLEANLTQWKDQRDKLNREIKSDAQREKKLSGQSSRSNRHGHRRAKKANEQLKETKTDERDTRDRLDAVEKQIKQAEKRRNEICDGDRYTVDCFALKLEAKFRDAQIYDHGTVLK